MQCHLRAHTSEMKQRAGGHAKQGGDSTHKHTTHVLPPTSHRHCAVRHPSNSTRQDNTLMLITPTPKKRRESHHTTEENGRAVQGETQSHHISHSRSASLYTPRLGAPPLPSFWHRGRYRLSNSAWEGAGNKPLQSMDPRVGP